MHQEFERGRVVTYIGPRSFVVCFAAICAVFSAVVFGASRLTESIEAPPSVADARVDYAAGPGPAFPLPANALRPAPVRPPVSPSTAVVRLPPAATTAPTALARPSSMAASSAVAPRRSNASLTVGASAKTATAKAAATPPPARDAATEPAGALLSPATLARVAEPTRKPHRQPTDAARRGSDARSSAHRSAALLVAPNDLAQTTHRPLPAKASRALLVPVAAGVAPTGNSLAPRSSGSGTLLVGSSPARGAAAGVWPVH